jgi:hypothetical protein
MHVVDRQTAMRLEIVEVEEGDGRREETEMVPVNNRNVLNQKSLWAVAVVSIHRRGLMDH